MMIPILRDLCRKLGSAGIGIGLRGTVLLGLLAMTPLTSKAEFLQPQQLSHTGGKVIQAAVGADLSFNAYVAWTDGERLYLDIIGVESTREIPLSQAGLGGGDPAIVTSTTGVTFIVFTQNDPTSGLRDVFLTMNPGGAFGSAVNLSQSPGDDYAPKIFLDRDGMPHVVWAQQIGNKPRVIYCPPGGPPLPLELGDYPGISMDGRGTVHLVYSRKSDLFYINNKSGGFQGEVQITHSPLDEEFFPSIAVTRLGNIFVAYERLGGLYYNESTDGIRFGPSRTLDSGGVTSPSLKLTGEILSIVYEKKGDLFYILGKVGEVLPSWERIARTEQVEIRPSLAIDDLGNLHISFIDSGEVFYMNNTGKPEAKFSADDVDGEAPLTVQFTDLSNGQIDVWRWDFGDGSPPVEDRNPVHVYENPGTYSVKLEIFGTGTTDVNFKENFISVWTPDNWIKIWDQTIYPGQKDIWFPVVAVHKKVLDGFQIVGVFDPLILQMKGINDSYSAVTPLEPEFFKTTWSNEPGSAYFYAGVIIDYEEPWDLEHVRVLPPSESQRLINLVFDCAENAPMGATTVIEMKNGVGPLSSYNFFSADSEALVPALRSSICTIYTGDPPGLFKRGDADGNTEVDLSDAIMILSYLFTGGERPSCLDAADVDDTGEIDIADPIYLLSFMFVGGTCPAVPFPNPGIDPTPEDDLPPCGP